MWRRGRGILDEEGGKTEMSMESIYAFVGRLREGDENGRG